jgi:multidrug efflux pump subunit AcrB
MMGEYMGPIPKFAIVALLLSIFIAFSINPWVSFLLTKDLTEADREKHHEKKESKYDVRKIYVKFMEKYIVSSKEGAKKRKRFKFIFWLSLILVIVLPLYLGIFKARMLPKSNKDQIYLWIDGVRSDTADALLPIEKDVEKFFLQNDRLPKELKIVESVSSTIGTPFMGDFANLFRGGSQRFAEYNLSARINLIPKEEEKNRLKSEEFTIKIRPLLRASLLAKYPDIKIRLLEDPP